MSITRNLGNIIPNYRFSNEYLKNNLRFFALFLVCLSLAILSLSADAITVPATTDFAYDVYDIIVVKILQGPVGFVGGLAAIVIGAAQLTKSWMLAILGILSGTVIIKADSIVSSLGMTISLM